ncbi:MAG: YceD family protein [Halanaerobium sp.]
MYINLSDLKEIGGRKQLSLELEFHNLEFANREIEIEKPIELELEIFNTRDSFVVEGKLKAELILSCSRCLQKYSSPVELDISEDVLKSEMEDEEELYLDEIVVDNIILSLPMKPLCSDNCKGICPKCGQDLNEGECDCEVEALDPRLAKLKDFYNEDE